MIVDSLCAINIVTRSLDDESSFTVSVISSSVSECSADVASSKMRSLGFRSPSTRSAR